MSGNIWQLNTKTPIQTCQATFDSSTPEHQLKAFRKQWDVQSVNQTFSQSKGKPVLVCLTRSSSFMIPEALTLNTWWCSSHKLQCLPEFSILWVDSGSRPLGFSRLILSDMIWNIHITRSLSMRILMEKIMYMHCFIFLRSGETQVLCWQVSMVIIYSKRTSYRRQASAWRTSHRRQASAWRTSHRRQASAWRTSHRRQASAWRTCTCSL